MDHSYQRQTTQSTGKLRRFLALFLTCALLIGLVPQVELRAAEPTGSDAVTMEFENAVFDREGAYAMLAGINAFRTSTTENWYWNSDDTTKTVVTGLSELTYDYALEQIAMQRALEIAFYWSHTRPDGTSCSTARYENVQLYGENLAAGNSTWEATLTQWKEEDEPYEGQGHRRNMLTNYNCIGIAHVIVNGNHYWVQEFGYQNSDKPRDEALPKKVKFAASNIEVQSLSADNMGLLVGDTVSAPAVSAVFRVPAQRPSGRTNIGTVRPSWTSSDSSIVRVENDSVVGVAEGSALLTSESIDGLTAESVVTVSSTGTIVVSYDANGGEGTSPISYSLPFGKVTLEANPFEKAGYYFAGWSTTPDGTGELYSPGTQLSLFVDTVFYAIWNSTPPVAQVIYSASSESLTFIYEPKVYAAGDLYNGKVVSAAYSGFFDTFMQQEEVPWASHQFQGDITTVEFKPEFKNVQPQYMNFWFAGLTNLTNIIGIENLDTSKVRAAFYLFYYCRNLQSVDVSNFVIRSNSQYDGMFHDCNSLTTIYCKDASTSWNISTNNDMFSGCTSLVGISGESRIPFDAAQIGSSMAKSAALGGYFTPKPAEPVQPEVTGYSLTMDGGKIGVNFFVDPGDVSAENITVVLKQLEPGSDSVRKENTVSLSGLEAEIDGTYKVSFEVAAKEMNDTLRAFIQVDGKAVGEPATYSVSDYYEAAAPDLPPGNPLGTLLDAMMLYGEAAQQYFGYNTGDMPRLQDLASTHSSDLSAEVPESFRTTWSGGLPEGLTVKGFTLLLESDTSIRLYFDLAEGKTVSDYTFKIGTTELTPVIATSGYGQYYIAIGHIQPYNYDEMFTFSVSDGTNTCSRDYSVLSYVLSKSTSSNASLVQLVKALYFYNRSMESYMNQ